MQSLLIVISTGYTPDCTSPLGSTRAPPPAGTQRVGANPREQIRIQPRFYAQAIFLRIIIDGQRHRYLLYLTSGDASLNGTMDSKLAFLAIIFIATECQLKINLLISKVLKLAGTFYGSFVLKHLIQMGQHHQFHTHTGILAFVSLDKKPY